MEDPSKNIHDVPPNRQREIICDKAGTLCYDDRLFILNLLKLEIDASHIIENADGSRINLDLLPDTIINKIYYIMISKLKISKKDTI